MHIVDGFLIIAEIFRVCSFPAEFFEALDPVLWCFVGSGDRDVCIVEKAIPKSIVGESSFVIDSDFFGGISNWHSFNNYEFVRNNTIKFSEDIFIYFFMMNNVGENCSFVEH